MSDTEKIVDDLKPIVLCGKVHGGDVCDHGVFGSRVVFQESEDGDDTRRCDVDAQLILPDGELLDVLGKSRHEVLAVLMEGESMFGVLVGIIDNRCGQLALGYDRC